MNPIRLAAILTLPAALGAQPETDRIDAAVRGAADWLRAVGVRTEHGTQWPADPAKPGARPTHLYSGTAGVVLFWLGLHRATRDESALGQARAGADALLRAMRSTSGSRPDAGLYTGLAGVGFALQEVARDTGDERYRGGALACVRRITSQVRRDGDAAAWGPVDDVISGTAGIGLYLLDAADALELPAARAIAAGAGRGLVARARGADGGRRWAMSPRYPRDMPNFSHGTAGIAYFLARLFESTGDSEFRDAAVAGARHLLAIADHDDDGCRIHHHTPGGEQLYYMGWCHGPIGTARLFHKLAEITGEDEWKGWVERCAASVMRCGIPAERLPGYWNNVGICCGAAGIVAFFLDLHGSTGRDEYLRFAREVGDDIVRRATRDTTGWRWVQSEHRVRPELLVAQTGYMQGAAGVGLALLRLGHGGASLGLRLPDDPFSR